MDEDCRHDRRLEPQGIESLKVEDSMSMEWTDEKHSLYLNSMEASFVDQLYSNKYHLKDLHGWSSRTQKHTNSQGIGTKTVSSGQFKVLRRGCWEKINFEKAGKSHNDTETEPFILSANPWIQHFRAASSIGKELHVPSSKQMDVTDSFTQPMNLTNQSHERTTTSVQFPCCSHVFCQDSIGCCAEVSDQNFVDQEAEEQEKLSTTCRKKKAKVAASNELSFKDQVVPLGKLLLGSTCEDSHLS